MMATEAANLPHVAQGPPLTSKVFLHIRNRLVCRLHVKEFFCNCNFFIGVMSVVDHSLNIFNATEEKHITCLVLNTSQFFFKFVSRVLEQLFWDGDK
jgi:hypothetical protein